MYCSYGFGQTSADSTVRVLSVSRFCPDFPENPVRCLSAVRILCPVSVCPDFVCLDSVRCPGFVRISRKNSVRCLSVRPDKDKTELSGLSLSLSADVWFRGPSERLHPKKSTLEITDSRTVLKSRLLTA